MKKVCTLCFLLLQSLIALAKYPTESKLTDSCFVFDGTTFCDDVIYLIRETGGVNSDLWLYDWIYLETEDIPSLAELLWLHDCAHLHLHSAKTTHIYNGVHTYNYILSFYEVHKKKPNTLAKSLMIHLLFEDFFKVNNPILHYKFLGWEYLCGHILPQDTLLGKQYLSMASQVATTPDSLELYILPFWRDSTYWSIYKHKHDSILRIWGATRNESSLQYAIIEYGDTIAYRQLMETDIYGENMIYAVYMVDQYGFFSAFDDIFLCLKKRYDRSHDTINGSSLQWLFELRTIALGL